MVTTGHVTKLSALPPAELKEMARRLADVGVAVTTLSATGFYLMGPETRGVRSCGALLGFTDCCCRR